MLIPDRADCPAGACRSTTASPCTPLQHPTGGAPLDEASTRVQAIHPSGLPLACDRPDGTGRPWAFPRASHPADQEPNDARRGGDRPSSTDRNYTLNSHQSISNPVVHSIRATSRRTSDSGSRTGLLDGTSRDCFSRIAITRSVDLEPTVRAALHMHARGRGGESELTRIWRDARRTSAIGPRLAFVFALASSPRNRVAAYDPGRGSWPLTTSVT